MEKSQLINKLCDIGIQLSKEKNVDTLLQIILDSCVDITTADAGSIYIVENNALVFKYTRNNSVIFPFKEFKLPIDNKSIAGNCVLNKKIYNLKSMHETIEQIGIKHNSSFDETIGYQTMNMLVIPLQNYYGNIIGVMQLINKKESDTQVINRDSKITLGPFTLEDEQTSYSLASQAAILIERNILFDELTELLDSIIITLTTALEQRDEVTRGHSTRVAEYAKRLALEVDSDEQIFSDINFTGDEIKELYIAGLLHDVGKIGVPEAILQKRNKLTDENIEAINMRYLLIRELIQNNEMKSDFENYFVNSTDEIIDNIASVNKSGYLNEANKELIDNLFKQESLTLLGRTFYYLTEDEYNNLSIQKGNLTEAERHEINMHAKKSKDILDGVKWASYLKRVPVLASKHHEKLNGKGYPYGFKKEDISVRERILSVIDIYDALTASDRPYKPAMPIDKAISIIQSEVGNGVLDKDIVSLFIDKKIYERN